MNDERELNQEVEAGGFWEMLMDITNNTSQVLTASCDDKPNWGWWYRDGEYKNKPASVNPGETIQAFGLRASRGSSTGYEGSCTWSLPNNLGRITLYVDVPYSAKNTSTLTVSGPLVVDGWSDIAKSGHRFVRSITISDFGNMVETSEVPKDIQDYLDYQQLLVNNNEMIQNWELLKAGVAEKETFNPIVEIPKEYVYPPREIFVGRAKALTIEKKFWGEIKDPIYSEYWQKQNYVSEYFAVEVFSVNTNPRCTESIPAGVKTITETTVEVASSIRSTIETNLSIRALLSATYGGVAAELETNYSITNALEESASKLERETRNVEIGVSDKNRIYVPWVFSKTVVIYRKSKKGIVTLLGVSEWADEIFNKVYEY